MKSLLLILLVLTGTARADVLNAEINQLALIDFNIHVQDPAIAKWIRCTKAEVDRGVLNFPNYEGEYSNWRDLQPSYQPLQGGASWYVSKQRCVHLAPFNGIGFDKFDPKTGDAILYLATFAHRPAEKTQWAAALGNSRLQWDLWFRWAYDIRFAVKFPAKCELTYPGFLSKVGLAEPELLCTFAAGGGRARFAVHEK